MSRMAMKEIIDKAVKDETFAQKLFNSPDDTLADVRGDLTADEYRALSALTPDTLKGFRAVLEEEKRSSKKKWYEPNSFKELGGAVLSFALVVLLFFAVIAAYRLVDTVPTVYAVGGNEQVVDTFQRSKDLLLILFPLFGAVISFWLGVAVEGRRADSNQDAADDARDAQKKAEEKETAVRTEAASALALVEGHLSAMSAGNGSSGIPDSMALGDEGILESLTDDDQVFESFSPLGAVPSSPIDDLLATVRQARSNIRT